MASRSFKASSIPPGYCPRSPQPSRSFIEPLSPARPTNLPSDLPAPTEKPATLANAHHHHLPNNHHTPNWTESRKRPNVDLAVNTSRASAYSPPAHSAVPKSQGSPIDTLATIALSTSPTYDRPTRRASDNLHSIPPPLWQGSSHPSHYSVFPPADRDDARPSKRARSEALKSPQTRYHDPRPATSHHGDNAWSYHASRISDGSYERNVGFGAPRQNNGVPDFRDQRMEDAALLLSLSQGPMFGSSPTVRYDPLAGGGSSYSWNQNPPASAPAHSVHTGFGHSLPPPQPYGSGHANVNRASSSGSGKHGKHGKPQPTAAIQTHTPPEESLDSNGDAGSNQSGLTYNQSQNGSSHFGAPNGRPQTQLPPVEWKRPSKHPPFVDSVPRLAEPAAPHQLQSPQSLPADDPEAHSTHVHSSSKLQRPAEEVYLKHNIPPADSLHSGHYAVEPRPNVESVSATTVEEIPRPQHPVDVPQKEWQDPLKAPQQSLQSKREITVCAACHMNTNDSTSEENDIDWIRCNGCKDWFHFACAGFKNERETRNVDKYFCPSCSPKHGPTTYVRKSSRAHTSVDYAGLNEGVLRATDDGFQHHYISSIKAGEFKTLPEAFPRMRPELVTAEYFERCGEFTQPIVIPAAWNPKPPFPGPMPSDDSVSQSKTGPDNCALDGTEGLEYEYVPEDGQDKLDMVIPQGLTVRRVAELYGPSEKVEIIDVKSQEGGDKRWNMRRWADYYEQEGEKPVRNVISLEVSKSRLGRLIRRPKVVRDMDLQDSVWPQDEASKLTAPAVQFYCLMSVADCYTDFHVDFGGSSVYYHILKGKKTFFFIPPKRQHLKKYEEWCLSPQQNFTWLPDQTKECYRIDLSEGDTMLIPSGWIHSVWTPENSLVIGGNFLTRLHYSMQLRILDIEKSTKVPRKFRYPQFQKVQWYTVIKYLQEDSLPQSVAQAFYSGQQFKREIPIYLQPNKFGHNSDPGPENYNARYYPKSELEGLPELAQFIFRTVMISLGRVEGVTSDTRTAVTRSIPKGYGDPLEIVKTFAIWAAWKRGNEDIPQWAHPDAVLPEQSAGEKKLSQAALRRLDRQAAIDAYRVAPDRQSARQKTKALEQQAAQESAAAAAATAAADAAAASASASPAPKTSSSSSGKHLSTPKTSVLGPKRIACDACRRRRIRCKHKDELVTIGSGTGDQSGHSASSSTPNSRRQNSAVVAVVIESNPKEHKHTIERPSKVQASPSQRNVAVMDGTEETPDGKRGRTKACADCRKSKRRCIHDEYGNIDPIKASETPVARGSNKKRRASGPAETERSLKKSRKSAPGIITLPKNLPPEDDDDVCSPEEYPSAEAVLTHDSSNEEEPADDFTASDPYQNSQYQPYDHSSHSNSYPEPSTHEADHAASLDYNAPQLPHQPYANAPSPDQVEEDMVIDPSLEAFAAPPPPPEMSKPRTPRRPELSPVLTNGIAMSTEPHIPPTTVETPLKELSLPEPAPIPTPAPAPQVEPITPITNGLSPHRSRSGTSRDRSTPRSQAVQSASPEPERDRHSSQPTKLKTESFSNGRRDSVVKNGTIVGSILGGVVSETDGVITPRPVGMVGSEMKKQQSPEDLAEQEASLRLAKELAGSDFGLRHRRS